MKVVYLLLGFEDGNSELYGKFASMEGAKEQAETLKKACLCECFEIKIVIE